MTDRQRLHDDTYRWEVVAALMRDHADAIMQYCLSWLGAGLAEEVTQDMFVTAWQGLPKYQPEASLRTWLFGIAHHKCQQAYRNRARRQAIARYIKDRLNIGHLIYYGQESRMEQRDTDAIRPGTVWHALAPPGADPGAELGLQCLPPGLPTARRPGHLLAGVLSHQPGRRRDRPLPGQP